MTFRRLAAVAALLACVGAGAARAEYPDHPIHVIYPYTPGGAGDALTRIWVSTLGNVLGQQVIVDNKPGAGANIGYSLAARAEPDGYTLLSGSASFTANPYLFNAPGYDPVKDFVPVAPFAEVPNVLIVPTDSPFHSIKDIVAAARARPGQLNFGSSGIGSSIQLAAELLKFREKLDMTHVPYKGAADAEIDLMGGRLDFMFDSSPTALNAIRTGKARPIAVATTTRLPELPETPTTAEDGFPYLISVAWIGVMAPAGTPPAIVAKLNASFAKVMADPAVLARLKAIGGVPRTGSAAEFGAFIKADLERNATVIPGIGLPKQ